MCRIFLVLALLFLSPLWACAQINWSNASGGNFLTATNWAGNVAPTSTDDAVISLGGTYTVTLAGSTTVNSLTLNNATTTFTQSAGTFAINNGFTFSTGLYNLTGGSMTLGGGMTMNGGTYNQSGGSTVNLTGTMTLNGATYNLTNGNIVGGSIAGGGNRLKVGTAGFGGVNIGLASLNLSATDSAYVSGTTFASGSVYSFGGTLRFDGSVFSGVSFQVTTGSSAGILGITNNATMTIGASGSSEPAVKLTSNAGLRIGLDSVSSGGGTNRSILNNDVIENSGTGTIQIINSGSFTNNGIIRNTSTGTITINPTGGFTNAVGSTLRAESGLTQLSGGAAFSNLGSFEILSSGTLDLNRNFTIANLGTVTRATPTTGALRINNNAVLTLSADYDVGTVGTLTFLNGGTVKSSTVSPTAPWTISSSNTARWKMGVGSVINYVNVAVGSLDLSATDVFIANGTTFDSGSVYSVGGTLRFGQPSFSGVSFQSTTGNSVGILGTVDNGTLTIGATGSSEPAIKVTSNASIRIGLDAAGSGGGTNRSIIITDLIQNIGTGTISVLNSGSLTNNGTVSNISTGTITINPTGAITNNGTIQASAGLVSIGGTSGLVLSSGSSLLTSSTGTIVISTTNVSNAGTVTATAGNFNVATGSTATFGNTASATTSIANGATMDGRQLFGQRYQQRGSVRHRHERTRRAGR